MPMVQVGEHTIELKNSWWDGDSVFYDGRLMERGNSIMGGSYDFKVKEDGEDAEYEVEFKSSLWWGGTLHDQAKRCGNLRVLVRYTELGSTYGAPSR